MTAGPEEPPATVPFDSLARLVDLAERERVAVDGRNWDELLEIQDEQQTIVEGLPDELPSAAKPILEHARARKLETEQALVGALAETKGILERLTVGRRAAGAYGSRSASALETIA